MVIKINPADYLANLDATGGTPTDNPPVNPTPQYLVVQDDKTYLYLVAIVALVILAIIVVYILQQQKSGV